MVGLERYKEADIRICKTNESLVTFNAAVSAWKDFGAGELRGREKAGSARSTARDANDSTPATRMVGTR